MFPRYYMHSDMFFTLHAIILIINIYIAPFFDQSAMLSLLMNTLQERIDHSNSYINGNLGFTITPRCLQKV